MASQDTPMMRQYDAIKQHHKDTILFFRMGDFYEMFGNDAVQASKVLQITLTSRNSKDPNPIPMCGVPYHSYENYLNKLTAAGFKVAICEQVEDPAKAKGIVRRDVVRVVTPGTTVSPQLIDPDQNHYLLSVVPQLQKKQLGVAFVDVSTGEFEVAQFSSNHLNAFYDFVYQIRPQEILMSQKPSEAEQVFLSELSTQLSQLLSQNISQNLVTPVDAYYFDPKASKQHLLEHFQVLNLSGFGVDHLDQGIRAAGALLHYLEDTQKCSLQHITSLKQHEFQNTMLLDESTVRNLEVFESPSGDKRHTLFHVLNQAKTPMGSRLLRQWIRQPLLKKEAIEARYDAIEEFHQKPELLNKLQQHLAQVQDLPRLAARISLPVVGIQDFVGLRQSLMPLLSLPEHLQHLESPLLQNLAASFDPLKDIFNHLQTTLLENPATKLREGGYIAEGVSEKLDELRSLSQNTKQILNEMVQRERESTGISSLKVSYNKVFGYYIEVSNAHKASVPEHYIRKQTLVNAERYITPDLKELEEKIMGAEETIQELEYGLFQELKSYVAGHIQRIQTTAHQIATLDALGSLAFIATHFNYVRPQLHAIEAKHQLRIQAGRHPVIEQIDLGEAFIPNDIALDSENQQIMIITGPNMAGKSTYMRQVALCVLMAQCGSYVPADQAELTVVNRIFTRIGASDNLSRGQSTFMVEMNEAAAILNNATEQSLIILDEIGRGTSTYDGISIAWSMIEHIHDVGSLTLFATHYHELTTLASELSRVKNYNVLVEEQDEQIVFMHKILPGEADRSYGVHVAKLAGLPKNVVSRALNILQTLEQSSLASRDAIQEEAASFQVKEPKISYQTAHPATDQTISETTPESSNTPEPTSQLSLFAEEPPILQELRELSLNNMTPLQALCYLNEIVEKIKSGRHT